MTVRRIVKSAVMRIPICVRVIAVSMLLMACGLDSFATVRANGTYQPQFYKRFSGLDNQQLLNKGYDYLSDSSKIDSALVCYSIVVNRWEDSEEMRPSASQTSAAYINLGNMYIIYYTDYKKAYEYLLRAEKVIENNKECSHSLGYLYLSLANIFQTQAGPQRLSAEAEDYLAKCFDSAVHEGDKELAYSVFVNLLNVSLSPESPRPEILRRPLQRLDSLGPPPLTPEREFTYSLLAAAKKWLGKDAEGAIPYLEKAVMLEFDPLASDRTEMVASQMLLRLLYITKRLDKVPAVLARMLDTAKVSGSHDLLASVYSAYYEYYSNTGDLSRAKEYRFLYLDQADSLESQGKIDGINEMRFLNDLDEVNSQVKELSYKKKVQGVVIWTASVLLVLVGAFAAFMVIAYRRLQEKNRLLYEQSVQSLKTPPDVETSQNDASQEEKGLFARIKELMESSTAIYSCDFNRQELAKLLGTNYTKVSSAINKCSGMSFSALLASYRIREAQRRLGDREVMATHTIESVALELGFQSRTSFASLFKKVVGMSPSAYVKQSQRG